MNDFNVLTFKLNGRFHLFKGQKNAFERRFNLKNRKSFDRYSFQ